MAEEEVANIFIECPKRNKRPARQKMENSEENKSPENVDEPMNENEEPSERVISQIGKYNHLYLTPPGPSQLHFLCPLGEGAYSTVYLARDTAQGEDSIPRYAVKVVDKRHVVKHDMVLQTLRELRVIEYLNFKGGGCPYIPTLFCFFQDDWYMYTVMKVCERGEFGQFFRGGKKMELDIARFYAAEILFTLDYIHRNGVVHRDVKPENILLSMDGHIVLADFGSCGVFRNDTQRLNIGVIMHPPRHPRLSDYVDDVEDEPEPKEEEEEQFERTRRSTFVGTAQYVSPEMLRGDEVGPECDLWAFGVLLYQMLTGTTPFKAINDYHLMKRIKAVEYTFPPNFDENAKDIITHLLQREPKDRYTMDDLKAHHFFKGTNWNKITHREPPPAYNFIDVKVDRLNEPKFWAKLPRGYNESIAANLINNQLKHSAQNSMEILLDPNSHQPLTTFDFSDDVDAPDDCIGSEAMQNLIKKTREARIQREKLQKQADSNKFHQFCQDKLILKQGILEKKKGMFYRNRMFVLTEGPRLFYVKCDNMEFKGEVPFSPHLHCEVRDFRVFYIHTPRRVYYLFDPDSKALDWCKAIMDLKRKNDDKLQVMWADAVERRVWPAVDMDKKKLRATEKERLKALKKANRGSGSRTTIDRLLHFFRFAS